MLELARDFIDKGVWVVFCELERQLVANRWDVRFDPSFEKHQIIVLNLKLIVDEDYRQEIWDAFISGEGKFQEIKESINQDLCYPLPDLVMIFYVLFQKNISEWKAKTISIEDMKSSKGQWIVQLMFQELMKISQKEIKHNEET